MIRFENFHYIASSKEEAVTHFKERHVMEGDRPQGWFPFCIIKDIYSDARGVWITYNVIGSRENREETSYYEIEV